MSKVIGIENEKFVDISEATAFENTATNGCIKLIFTSGGTRIRLDKTLLSDIENPENVNILFTEKNVIVLASENENSFKIKSGGIIYNSELAKKVAEIAGIEVMKNGSKKIGTYHLQEHNEKTIAVVSFE